MTESEDYEAYDAFRQRLEADFLNHPEKYATAKKVMRAGIRPDEAFEEINMRIMLTAQKLLKVTYKQFESAMEWWGKERVKEERKAAEAAAAAITATAGYESFGPTPPTTAREAVQQYCQMRKIVIKFDHSCTENGVKSNPENPIVNRVMLEAEALRLTFGDGKIMSNAGIAMAWIEHVAECRAKRKAEIWAMLQRKDPIANADALRRLRSLCDKLFIDGAFADAAVRKFIWQVKRRMEGSYIEHLHFLIFGGGQGTGKSEFARNLFKPLKELSCESSMDQIADDKNFAIHSTYVVFVDELAKADKADLAKFKTVVTQKENTSRIMYSHASAKISMNMTLLGTADKRVRQIVYDAAGMRRFVEVLTKPKHLAERFDWVAEVDEFPWLTLWQAVDHTAVDPLMSQFEAQLRGMQEDMRARDNVEAWLENFEADIDAKHITALQPTSQQPGRYAEFGAEHLYQRSFRSYEDAFHPGSTKTSLTSWGSTLKAMIEANKLPRWSVRKAGHKVFYKLQLAEDMKANPHLGAMVVALHRSKQEESA